MPAVTQPPYGQYPPPGQYPEYPPPQYSGGYQSYPPPGAYPPYPPPKVGTNGFAVASLIFGILGGFLLSIIFGIVALTQIPKRRQGGKGLAIAGLTLSGLWVVAIIAVISIAIATSADRDSSGNITAGGRVSIFDLKVGDCFNGLEEGRVTSVKAVPCGEPHDAEVFAVFNLTGSSSYPGEDALFDKAQDGCNDRLEGYSAKAVDDSSIDLYVFYPDSRSWSRGDREATCVAGSSSQKHTGSLRD